MKIYKTIVVIIALGFAIIGMTMIINKYISNILVGNIVGALIGVQIGYFFMAWMYGIFGKKPH